MYNTSNPAELYSGTTWELLATDKYLKTTTRTPLSTGGSNSFTISKANLPATKLQVESFSLTRGTMNITGEIATEVQGYQPNGAFYTSSLVNSGAGSPDGKQDDLIKFDASRSWTGSTSSASPYTTNMGNGTSISINPVYITIRA